MKEKEQLQKIIDEVAQLEDEWRGDARVGETQGLQTSNRASELLDEKKTKEELQNELKELDNALRRMNRGIAQKEASCRKIDEEIAPLSAQFVELRAQSKYLIGASKAAAKESEASKALAEMSMKIQEQMKLVSALQGTELLEIGEDSSFVAIGEPFAGDGYGSDGIFSSERCRESDARGDFRIY